MSAPKDLPPLSTAESRGSISGIPMQDVEPSPVEEQEEDAIFPTDVDQAEKLSISSRSTTNFLGLSPSTTLKVLSAVQKYAVVPPSIYLVMHYANTAIIPLMTQNVVEADRYLLLTRPYYQSFPIEPLMIFAPVITHVVSGIALRIYRRRQNAKRHGAETHAQRKSIPWPKVSLTSALGYALYPMFVGHMLAMRIIPKQVEGSSSGVGLRYFAHGIAHNPVLGNLGYATMLCVASWHFVTGAAKYLKLSTEYITEGGESGRARKLWRGRAINGVAAVIAGLWIAGGLGVVGRGGQGVGWEAAQWDKIYRSIPLFGQLH